MVTDTLLACSFPLGTGMITGSAIPLDKLSILFDVLPVAFVPFAYAYIVQLLVISNGSLYVFNSPFSPIE
ncbi:hypothetical protein D3C72_2412630 [compost metagenome]